MVAAKFFECFKLARSSRVSATCIAKFMRFYGFRGTNRAIRKWMAHEFTGHEFVRKDKRGWKGLAPRFEVYSCTHCGSCLKAPSTRVALADRPT